ncbi:MAG: glycosyl hydrolase [Thermoanaerobaculia bacterium]|nr:glycosyl hydrolase [Thermoanaerobaculia bacterium]
MRPHLLIVLALFLAPTDTAIAKRADSKTDAAETDEVVYPVDPDHLESLAWRDVGPLRGGRVAAVAGIPQDRETYYFGATGGGVWKTTNAGVSWAPISDGTFGGSIGAVAVSEWDPNVVWVGGGEKTVRGNVSHGDGVWRSVDAGKTWTHVGLADSRHVPRIRIHPRNPDEAWVCALGHLFGPNEERGVFHTQDGGATWTKVLYTNENAGCVDLALDPNNPRVLYATFWRVKRTPWSLESGGEGSTMWKSTDSGETWTEITANPGLPTGTLGIMGIDVSRSNSDNLYAIVEAEDGGVFRSRDAGATWTRTNEERALRQRAWYYTRIYADPTDEEQVYVLNVRFHRSKDGGRSFQRISVPHGDNHDLWIDPADPLRMIQSNDGGANVSEDGGETWSTQRNQPTAQMYRVSTDNAFPYRILGGQQDNSTIRMRHRSFSGGGIDRREWEPSAGCECGHVVAKPDDPDIVYGGCYGGQLERVDHRTGSSRAVDVWPDDPMGWGAADLKYRFQWNFPLFFSPHDPNRLYTAAQVLFRSDDSGESWQVISPDLTHNDASKMGASGGPITKDNTSVEYYGTIFAALESPHEKGVLWAGTDDGRLHISRDDGENWAEVTPEGLPPWMQINSIEAHPTEPGGLYVAGTRYKLDDFRPYLYKTSDYGASWSQITDGIDDDHFTRVIRADPDRAGLLYAGTERGVYVSFDDGGEWQPLQLNLPHVPITDLAVKEKDLVAATQGRGFWILDDLSLLHQIEAGGDASSSDHHLYAPRTTLRLAGFRGFGSSDRTGADPATGAVLRYHMAALEDGESEPATDKDPADGEDGDDAAADETQEAAEETTESVAVKLEILEPDGDIVRTFTAKPPEGTPPDPKNRDAILDVSPGSHRIVWNLRYAGPENFAGMVVWNRASAGPTAVPGTYSARLTVGEGDDAWTQEVPIEVVKDPRSSASQADLREQFDFLVAVRDKLTETHQQVGRIRDAKGQIQSVLGRLPETPEDETDPYAEVRDQAKALTEALEKIEKALYQTQNQSPQDPLNFPIRLNDKLAGLYSTAMRGDFRPTAGAKAVRDDLVSAIDEELAALEAIWSEQLPAFNNAVKVADVPYVKIEDETED